MGQTVQWEQRIDRWTKTQSPFGQAVESLTGQAQEMLSSVCETVGSQVREIRLRVARPIDLYTAHGHLFVGREGRTFRNCSEKLPVISQMTLEECFRSLCAYSIHTHQQDIRHGFVTVRGGHRAGICGSCVWEEGHPPGMRDISSICLRIAREIPGAAGPLAAYLFESGTGLLLAGKPGSGKTTMLRDLARQLADGVLGEYRRVAVVDERGELGAVFDGEPQHHLGVCCDILDGYPKKEGIEMAVRTLSPDYVICDELGGIQELEAVRQSVCRGTVMVASIHAANPRELLSREGVEALLRTGAFPQVAFLGSRPGEALQMVSASSLLRR